MHVSLCAGAVASSPSAYLEHRVRELQEALEKQDREYRVKVQGLQQKFSAIEVSELYQVGGGHTFPSAVAL